MNRSLRIVARLAAIAAGFMAMERFALAPYVANRVIHRVEIRTHAAVEAADPQRAAVLARMSLNDLTTITPVAEYDVNYHLLFAVNARLLDQATDALAHYDAALRADHRPEIYFERALTLIELGRVSEAIPDFVTAARFNPKLLNILDPPIRDLVEAQLHR